MEMTNAEILYKVKQQRGDFKYVSILAQLNGCSTDVIARILLDNGWVKTKTCWKKSDKLTETVEAKQEKCSRSKFTKEQKLEIARYYKQHSDMTYAKMAKKFGCSEWTIGNICRNLVDDLYATEESVDIKESYEKTNGVVDANKKANKQEKSLSEINPHTLIISDPEQVSVVLDALEGVIKQKEKELKLLYNVRNSIASFEVVTPAYTVQDKTPLFENK